MKKAVKITLWIILTAIFAAVMGLAYFIYDTNRSLPDLTKEQVFKIEKGDGVNQVALRLKQQGIIRNTFNFETYLWLNKQEDDLQAGEYSLNPGVSVVGLVQKFIAGNIVPQEVWITIPEGFTGKEIEERLVEKGLAKEGEFIKKITNYKGNKNLCTLPEGVGSKKDCSADSLEGYLFPDTYKFFKDATIDEIINKMLVNFDKKLTTDLRKEIEQQDKTVEEIIILASIIEKEVSNTEDAKKVASVFYNRLAIDMRLESDATVNFATGKSRRQATLEDIEIDSLYNTYLYGGIPPSPISNPGLNAIEAAIYPAETDFFYFLSPEDGSTIFSKTFEEHLVAKNKYLK